jgi:hypothetical protein
MTDAPSPPPSPHEPAPRPADRRIVWPYVLIGVGLLLLLTNVGWLSGGAILSLLNLWPIVLLAVGIDLLTNGRYRLPVVVGAIVVVLVLWLGGLGGGGLRAFGTVEPVQIEHLLDGARAAEVELRLGVGEVRVDADAPPRTLIAGTILTGRGERVEEAVGRRGDVARLEITTRQQPGMSISGMDRRRWDLSLTREVPVDLRVEAGVGDARFDLREADLARLSLQGGVGEITVILPERGGYVGELDLGVGETDVVIPRSVEARVTVNMGLGGVDVEGPWQQNGRVYTTDGYASAASGDRIELTIGGGIGGVEVERE